MPLAGKTTAILVLMMCNKTTPQCHLAVPYLICIINLYEWIWDASIKCIGILSKSLKRKSD